MWHGPQFVEDQATVYLTFDDGPHPEITRDVIRVLKEFDALATFFCVGANVARFPDVLTDLRANGHAVGNHSQQHESGWTTSQYRYLKSYLLCQERTQADWFRPPYGRITRQQAKALGKHTVIVMWDVLSGDFDAAQSAESCLEQLQQNTRAGSIIVFHDSERAAPRMLAMLSPYLSWLRESGYRCALLPKSTD